jgi:hypothetical protein
MSKREKIIVGFMVAAILYGGYNFLFSHSAGGKKNSYRQPLVGASAFVADLVKQIQAADTTATDTKILEKSATAWQKDPFLVVEKTDVAEEGPEKKPEIIAAGKLTGAFRYSGYMEMGNRKLAIINGMEYLEGDQLAIQGAVLKKITPGEVQIYVETEKGIVVVPIDDTAN